MPASLSPRGSVKPCFRAALGADNVLEFLIYEEIGATFDWWTGESSGISAKSVKAEIDSAANYSSIRVRINSPGGDAFEGVAILNILKTQGKPVNVLIDGIAASAASIIAMAGDTIEMGSGAMMMIHQAWGVCIGNATDMSQMAGALSSVDKSIAKTYADRSGQDIAKISAMMSAETWLTADEAVELKLATSTQGEQPDGALAMARNFKALARFAHVPKNLKPEPAPADNQQVPVAPAAVIPPQETESMAEPNTQPTAGAPNPEPSVSLDQLRAQARGDNLEIIEICALAGRPQMAVDFIKANASPADARKQLIDLNAKAGDAAGINSHIEPEASTGARAESPVVAQAKKMANQQKGRTA
jgi:ATP-dependent Clp protease protease subunit